MSDDVVRRLRDLAHQFMHYAPSDVGLLSAAADRIAALEAERAWRPIETAPRDQPHVLAWQPGAYTPYIAYCFMGSWETDADQYNDSERYFPSDCQPTHWMPLPAPPEDKP